MYSVQIQKKVSLISKVYTPWSLIQYFLSAYNTLGTPDVKDIKINNSTHQ